MIFNIVIYAGTADANGSWSLSNKIKSINFVTVTKINPRFLPVSTNQFLNILLCSELKLRSFHEVPRRYPGGEVCVQMCGALSRQWLMLMSERGLSFSDTI